ncbi:MAG: hypothetical protein CEE38_01575 [Planctomycetes bacterium B3_Pla]|nr:MAG: hypothetical protein CEE38_01575 [Planctomycetes bacterium B3_Pla]
MANSHLVILKEPYLSMILKDRKRIELRLHKTRRPVFGCVWAGDKLFLKASSGPVRATATARVVKNYENLTPKQILEIKRLYNHDIAGPDEYWRDKMDCKFGFLVWLKDVKPIKPVRIDMKGRRVWVVLKRGKDFGLLKKNRPR